MSVGNLSFLWKLCCCCRPKRLEGGASTLRRCLSDGGQHLYNEADTSGGKSTPLHMVGASACMVSASVSEVGAPAQSSRLCTLNRTWFRLFLVQLKYNHKLNNRIIFRNIWNIRKRVQSLKVDTLMKTRIWMVETHSVA